jgi:DNA-binding LacI/PurR family transcriptional regulator
MRDVAEAAGVSQATVSNAYNRPDRLSAAQRERVLEVAASLGYPGPNAAGRSLRTGRVGAIGVMVTDALTFALEDAAAVDLLRGIAAVGEVRDIALTLLPFTGANEATTSSERGTMARDAARTALRGVVDGFLVFSMPDGHPAVEAALSRRQPLVIIDAPRLRDVPSVAIRERRSARDAAAYVLGLGHRRVGILVDRLAPDGFRGPVDAARRRAALDGVARERVTGYLQACRAAGLAQEDVTVVEAGGFSPRDFAEATDTLLAAADVSAIFASTDAVALTGLAHLRERGIDVPGQISVLGFDDVGAAERERLTTVRQPIVEKGRRATRMLLACLDGAQPGRIYLPTELIVRGTTALPKRAARGR